MTEQKPAEKQSSPAADETSEVGTDTRPQAQDKGFFNRVQRVLSRTKQVHPSEAEEIVIMDEGDGDR